MLPFLLAVSNVMPAAPGSVSRAVDPHIVVSLRASAAPTITVSGVTDVRAYELRDAISRRISTEVRLPSGERLFAVTREPAESSQLTDAVVIQAGASAVNPLAINGSSATRSSNDREEAAQSTLEWSTPEGSFTVTSFGAASIELESEPDVSTNATTGETPPSRPVFLLHPVGPNPFQGSMMVRFQIPAAGRVSLALYDVAGRRVATLLDEPRTAGAYSVEHRPSSRLARGQYYLRLSFTEKGGATRTATQPVVRLR